MERRRGEFATEPSERLRDMADAGDARCMMGIAECPAAIGRA